MRKMTILRLFYKKLLFIGLALCFFTSPTLAENEMNDTLPAAIIKYSPAPLMPVGSGTYRKLGFSVYKATLWAPNSLYNPNKPYALELHYTRSVSKDTLVDTVMDDIREQNVTDDETLSKWQTILTNALKPVEDGDTMIGLAVPGKNSRLFFNGVETASLNDPAFSKAFFNIWLGDHADENLKNKLLANAR